jgi:hypothetical protein
LLQGTACRVVQPGAGIVDEQNLALAQQARGGQRREALPVRQS